MKERKYIFVSIIFALVLAQLAYGCRSTSSTSKKSKEKRERKTSKKENKKDIEGIPKIFVFPDSEVVGKFNVTSANPAGGVAVTLRSEAKLDKVEKYYEETPVRSGWEKQMDLWDTKKANFMFKKGKTNVTVHIEDLGKKREIVITSNVVETK